MQLNPLIYRTSPPVPWAEGETIPWNDPDFSRRMLREHLTQEHDAASRRTEKIEAHVAYIRTLLPAGRPARILDLGCGPGLYARRLAAAGHHVRGIDFSPASIAYAREQAEAAGLGEGEEDQAGGSNARQGSPAIAAPGLAERKRAATAGSVKYIHADMREAEFGAGYDLAMLIFGEFNVFQKHDARRILLKVHAALNPGGLLLLEPHPFDAVRAIGEEPRSWSARESGLFSDRPYLYLEESFWDPERAASTTRYFIIDAETGDLTRHSASMQAYTDGDYRALLEETGFSNIEFGKSLTGSPDGAHPGLIIIRAEK